MEHSLLPQTSPISYSIAGRIANGVSHTVEVTVSGVSCPSSTTYNAPGSCVSLCLFSDLGLMIGTCDNKGTLSNANDDGITLTLNPTGNGIGAASILP